MAARYRDPVRRPGGTGQGVPQQEEGREEARGTLGGLGVPVEPCGLELDW